MNDDELIVEFAMNQRIYKTYRLPKPDWYDAEMVQADDDDYTSRLYEYAQENGIFQSDDYGDVCDEPQYNITWTSEDE